MAVKPTQTITPFLWFDDKAEQAANFYVSIFKNSRVLGRHDAVWRRRTGAQGISDDC